MIKAMERTVATVSENGQLVLPAQVLDALELPPGTEVEILLHDRQLELKRPRKRMSPEELEKSLEELHGIFAGGPSLEDDLYQMRREEEEHFRRKFGW
jgi:AbrB family looped-hinge helix DNA binding protein